MRDLKGPVKLERGVPRIHRRVRQYEGDEGEYLETPIQASRRRDPDADLLVERDDVPPSPMGDRATGFAAFASRAYEQAAAHDPWARQNLPPPPPRNARGPEPEDDVDGRRWMREASSGAGSDVNYDYDERRGSGPSDYGGDSGGPSTTFDTDSIEGDADLFDQPAEQPRREYGDATREYGDTARGRGQGSAGYTDRDAYFNDNRSSPTVDLGGGRSPRPGPRDSTFARRNLK